MRFDKDKTVARVRAMFAAATLGVMFALGATVAPVAAASVALLIVACQGQPPDACGDPVGNVSVVVPRAPTLPAIFDGSTIAVDDSNLYWIDASGSVLTAPKSGGAAIELAGGQPNLHALAIDASNAYWAVSGKLAGPNLDECPDDGIVTVPKHGEEVSRLDGICEVAFFAVDSTNIYWDGGNRGYLGTTPKTGGNGSVLFYDTELEGAVALDDTHAYWAHQGQVDAIRKNDGAEDGKFNIGSNQGNGTDQLVVDGTSLYWLGGAVERLPKSGGSIEALAPRGTNGPSYARSSIASDESNIYWVDSRGSADWDSGYCGDLMKVSKKGGAPVTLASSQQFPQPGLAVDATSVYWVSTDGVVRVAK